MWTIITRDRMLVLLFTLLLPHALLPLHAVQMINMGTTCLNLEKIYHLAVINDACFPTRGFILVYSSRKTNIALTLFIVPT